MGIATGRSLGSFDFWPGMYAATNVPAIDTSGKIDSKTVGAIGSGTVHVQWFLDRQDLFLD